MSAGIVETITPGDHPPLQVVPSGSVDLEAATRAVFDLLLAVGQDPTSAELAHTPRRVATALAASLTSDPFAMTTFANDGGYDEMVVMRDISFQSLCTCHLLPFSGVAHVAYVPEHRVVGLSKIVRVVEHFSRGLQTPGASYVRGGRHARERARSTRRRRGVRATHLCMTAQGAASRPSTVTTAMRGLLQDDPAIRDEFTRVTRASARTSN